MLIESKFELTDSFPSSQFISGDGLRESCLSHLDVHYLKRDFLFRGGGWRGGIHPSLFDLRRNGLVRSLVVGHSDISTTFLDQSVLKAFRVRKLFGVNIRPIPGFSESIPLGLTNDCDDSSLHRLFGNTRLLFEAADESGILRNFSPKLYVNFSASTNQGIRNKLLELVSELRVKYRILRVEPNFTYSGRLQYLGAIRECSMVLCPQGNGIETHRFWETLYMGGVPIVVRNSFTESLYRKFPIIELNSWNDLKDVDLIEHKWIAANKLQWDGNLLRLGHWTTLVTQ